VKAVQSYAALFAPSSRSAFPTYANSIPHNPHLEYRFLPLAVIKKLVFRSQGWISAVVLINGSIQGVWQQTRRGSQTVVTVHLFCPDRAEIHRGIEAAVERLSDFSRTKITLEYEQPQLLVRKATTCGSYAIEYVLLRHVVKGCDVWRSILRK
jgi:hypothetical protein